MVYISIVGTQIMAVLNPLLAILGEKDDSENRRIILLVTMEKTRGGADDIGWRRIEDMIALLAKSYGVQEHEVTIEVISDSMSTDARARQPAHEALKKALSNLKDRKMFFNVAGGMNFQIAACLAVIAEMEMLEGIRFLYPESTAVHEIVFAGTKARRRILPLPSPVPVLVLQGSPWQLGTGDDSPFLRSVCTNSNVEPPEHVMRHVTMGGIDFDWVWNSGNELSFLKVFDRAARRDKSNEDRLIDERKLIDWSCRRIGSGELFHRRVLVLTDIIEAAERFAQESQGKIEVAFVSSKDARGFKNSFARRSVSVSGSINLNCIYNKTEPETRFSKGLLVALGRDILPTLIALWSHSPDTVRFLYTPGIDIIDRYVKAITQHEKLLPTKAVEFWPVSISGIEAVDMKQMTCEEIELDITPGPKSMTLFPILWLSGRKGSTWSIDTKSQQIRSIMPQGYHKRLSGPDPLTILRLSGQTIKREGATKAEILQKKHLYSQILFFIKSAFQEEISLSEFPHGDQGIHLNAATYTLHGHNQGQICFKEGPTITWNLNQSKWFEELIGYAFIAAGADDVRVRIQTAWTEGRQAALEQKHQGVHRTDIDVVARFAGNYFVVECKSGKRARVRRVTGGVSAVANLFGRFAVPLVAHLDHHGEPVEIGGVYMFGYRTFVDSVALNDLIGRSVADRRTTGTH
ncbi:MAG: hypothetical protein A4E57_00778 [Syntrophorhabdaceae bacterium PtaU1.Bin034]|nr:MAG: hypothetical protein A4E57_00778 [Syntrophorhabdaceae bacterium PtaU1.Bin034]